MEGWTLNVPTTTCIWLVLLGVALSYTATVFARYGNGVKVEVNILAWGAVICYLLSIVAYFAGAA